MRVLTRKSYESGINEAKAMKAAPTKLLELFYAYDSMRSVPQFLSLRYLLKLPDSMFLL